MVFCGECEHYRFGINKFTGKVRKECMSNPTLCHNHSSQWYNYHEPEFKNCKNDCSEFLKKLSLMERVKKWLSL